MVYDHQIRSSTRLGIGGMIKVNKVSAVLTALLSGTVGEGKSVVDGTRSHPFIPTTIARLAKR